MLHIRKFLHNFSVFVDFLLCAKHHFVLHFTNILDLKANSLAGFDGDGARYESHLVVHLDGNRTIDLLWITRLSGWRVRLALLMSGIGI